MNKMARPNFYSTEISQHVKLEKTLQIDASMLAIIESTPIQTQDMLFVTNGSNNVNRNRFNTPVVRNDWKKSFSKINNNANSVKVVPYHTTGVTAKMFSIDFQR
jgi:hypothetical protein